MRYYLVLFVVLASPALSQSSEIILSPQDSLMLAVGPSEWFPLATDQGGYDPARYASEVLNRRDLERGRAYQRTVNALVEADCPLTYPFSFVDAWDEPVTEGDLVPPHVIEHCVTAQNDAFSTAIGDSLDVLHDEMQMMETEWLDGSDVLTAELRRTHSAWLLSSQRTCDYESIWYFGGTGGSFAWLDCFNTALRQRSTWVASQLVRVRESSADFDESAMDQEVREPESGTD